VQTHAQHEAPDKKPIVAESRDEDMVLSEFDESYYLARYKYFTNNFDGGLLQHYLLYGAVLGFDPNSLFSTTDYLNLYPDVRTAGTNPLVDFLRRGKAQGRRPNARSQEWHSVAADFDIQFYLSRYQDVAERALEPVQHYLADGWKEYRDPTPWFSTKYYLDSNPDVKAKGENPFLHFLLTGRAEGRAPSNPRGDATAGSTVVDGQPRSASVSIPDENFLEADLDDRISFEPVLFDSDFPTVVDRDFTSPANPILDDSLFTQVAPRRQMLLDALSEFFDADFYLSQYPDVRRSGFDPFQHFVLHGWDESRAPNACFSKYEDRTLEDILTIPKQSRPAYFNREIRVALLDIFDEAYYLRANPDVVTSGLNALHHFVSFGARENRNPSKLFRVEVYTRLYPDAIDDSEGLIFGFFKLPAEEREKRLKVVSAWRGRTDRNSRSFDVIPSRTGYFLLSTRRNRRAPR